MSDGNSYDSNLTSYSARRLPLLNAGRMKRYGTSGRGSVQTAGPPGGAAVATVSYDAHAPGGVDDTRLELNRDGWQARISRPGHKSQPHGEARRRLSPSASAAQDSGLRHPGRKIHVPPMVFEHKKNKLHRPLQLENRIHRSRSGQEGASECPPGFGRWTFTARHRRSLRISKTYDLALERRWSATLTIPSVHIATCRSTLRGPVDGYQFYELCGVIVASSTCRFCETCLLFWDKNIHLNAFSLERVKAAPARAPRPAPAALSRRQIVSAGVSASRR
ncbi:hypothetical protein EVAR_54985_1 [Eumeta japonica]|uniref:Uncharacterized protein n=1 Tax=Eumeta variegata TaxID=151549 RepID=A0A4C1Z3S1_EUMVA|nr:hypothetical protein EVAR_54985_1 [Eumeta japonica]